MISNMQDLQDWYENTFKQTKLFADMAATVEGSPYHREANVGVHTDMVFGEYVKATNEFYKDNLMSMDSIDFDLLGGFACIFHDVGKPSSCVVKENAERGVYKSFPGHESKSAKMFENYAAKHLLSSLNAYQIYLVSWMIEYHLPWSITKPAKRQPLIDTVLYNGLHDVFPRLLMSDQLGRTSDSSHAKIEEGRKWCDELVESTPTDFKMSNKILYVPIGASGIGKSSYRLNLSLEQSLTVFSLDDLRHKWYDKDDYRAAWEASVTDSTFSQRAWKEFVEVMNNPLATRVYVDNTNTSKKSRRQYIDLARKRGYSIEACYFICDLQTIIDRQETRTDKTVPKEAVIRQYFQTQSPSLGEFDYIDIICSV